MDNKSKPPVCVKDEWWEGRYFCREMVGLLCSTTVEARESRVYSRRYCSLTSDNLSPIIPFSFLTCFQKFALSSIPFFLQHLFSPLLPFLFSLPHYLSLFPLFNFFSLSLSFYTWLSLSFLFCVLLCVHSVPLYFPFSLSVFLFPALLPSISFPLSHPLGLQWQSDTELGTKGEQKIEHGSISALMGPKVSWERHIEKAPC